MSEITCNGRAESTLAFLKHGYDFIRHEADRLGVDVFQTRLKLRQTICLRGPGAAELFYDNDRIQRRGACPMRIVKTLFGVGGVQTLDDEAHLDRKAMLMSLFTDARIGELIEHVRCELKDAADRWESEPQIVVLPAMQRVMCRAACQWASVPLEEGDADQVAKELAAIIDGCGGIGPRYVRARLARRRSNRWAEKWIGRVRRGEYLPSEYSALMVIATHRGIDGELLPCRHAAVELLNVLRPSVAIARWVMFAVLAMHAFPEAAEAVKRSVDGAEADHFGEEVRRYYPFFPAVVGKTRREFTWDGLEFPAKTRVLLDLWGRNRDPRFWGQPGQFNPSRFHRPVDRKFLFIPQGGGDFHTGHRCAGEVLTRRVLAECIRWFAQAIRYDVPEQNLEVAINRFPAEPESRMVIANVRANETFVESDPHSAIGSLVFDL
ncbi:cytochrome P450 [Aporhodopirellula aestuarii]|uniref:Cytochrome P450 n=1 Tax=Aporhodopirellula aestuarii TaxID=2950107 RepID=A0ABT0TXQ1_9BACT|nr:cytochrome P450 [Aporhodopirellula aestuarii]MCM2369251.1 cytochrome P450 [Aporhodopirellula aestuarii]